MVGVGVWVLVRWLTYILMAMATVWRGRDVEDAPSRRSGGQVRSGQFGSSPGWSPVAVPSEYRIGPVRPDQPSPQQVEVRRSCRPTTDRMDEPASRPITTDEKSHQSHQHHIEWVRCASHASVRRVAKGERRQGQG